MLVISDLSITTDPNHAQMDKGQQVSYSRGRGRVFTESGFDFAEDPDRLVGSELLEAVTPFAFFRTRTARVMGATICAPTQCQGHVAACFC